LAYRDFAGLVVKKDSLSGKKRVRIGYFFLGENGTRGKQNANEAESVTG